ncbi:hypothetical protein B0H14DRAFT_2631918 [Mycena olivaceomarginata]|nr:hypothetical protein B0H14DRAFT_2631918 [Mycena olivaceomarginata]
MTLNGNNGGAGGVFHIFMTYSDTAKDGESSSLSLIVVNNAIVARSACSFTQEGRFTAMVANVKAGDYVIIEFGHNDGGSLTPTDNRWMDCPVSAAGYTTMCTSVFRQHSGVTETMLTYEAYLVNATKLF